MTFPARRPWWKKTRWAAALAMWLVVYVLSLPPAAYLAGRYRSAEGLVAVAYLPVFLVMPPPECPFAELAHWCYDRGETHREAASD